MDMIAMLAGLGYTPAGSGAPRAGADYTGTGSRGYTPSGRSGTDYTSGSKPAVVDINKPPSPPAPVPEKKKYFEMRGLDFNTYADAAARNTTKPVSAWKQAILDRVAGYLKTPASIAGIVGAWANYQKWPAPDGSIVSAGEIQLATEIIDPVIVTTYGTASKETKDIYDRRRSYSLTTEQNPLYKSGGKEALEKFKTLLGKYPSAVTARRALTAASAALFARRPMTYSGVTYAPIQAEADIRSLIIIATIYPPLPSGNRAIDGIVLGPWWADSGELMQVYNQITEIRNSDIRAYKVAKKAYDDAFAAWKKAVKDAADAEANRKIDTAKTAAEKEAAKAERAARDAAAAKADLERQLNDRNAAYTTASGTITELKDQLTAAQAALEAAKTSGGSSQAAAEQQVAALTAALNDALNATAAAAAAANAEIERLKGEVAAAQRAAAEAARNANQSAGGGGGGGGGGFVSSDTSQAAADATQAATDATQIAVDALQQTGETVTFKPPAEKKGGSGMLLVLGAVAVGGYFWWRSRRPARPSLMP